MKRIESKLPARRVPYCQAYKEDIQQVIDLMTKDGQPPQLTSGGYEFDNANEFFSFLGEKGRADISIQRFNPLVSVSALRHSDEVTVSTFDGSDATVVLVHRVGEVLSQCAGKKSISERRWFYIAGLILLFGGFYKAVHSHSALHALLAGGVSIIGLVISVLGYMGNYTKANMFYGIPRNSRKSFLQRKGDDLLVALIAGVVGAFFGVAGTLLTQAYTAHETQGSAVQSNTGPSVTPPTSH